MDDREKAWNLVDEATTVEEAKTAWASSLDAYEGRPPARWAYFLVMQTADSTLDRYLTKAHRAWWDRRGEKPKPLSGEPGE